MSPYPQCGGVIGTPSISVASSPVIGCPSMRVVPVVFAPVNLLVDGDMEAEDTSAWTPLNNALLTKETASPYQGLRCLRIAYNGSNNPYARQTILSVGKTYRCIGVARSDGTAIPYVYLGTGSASWTGTTSLSWQPFDITRTADASLVAFQSVIAAAGYCEFDYIRVWEA